MHIQEFPDIGFAKATLLALIVVANLMWLLNPHACCPRETSSEPTFSGQTRSETSCCMHTTQPEPDNEAISGQSNQTAMPQLSFVSPDNQFSKGVNNWVSNSIPTSASLLQSLGSPAFFIFTRVSNSDIPQSAILPLLKKPPCV
jgi:hypothetical protein